MKQNNVRRDPSTKADGKTDHEALRAERDAEAERDLRLGSATRHAGDEAANTGRAESELAGGNGEQRSRERARVMSEADPKGKQPPFPKRAEQNAAPTHTGAEQAIADDERTTLPRGERSSAPMSQSAAAIKDFR